MTIREQRQEVRDKVITQTSQLFHKEGIRPITMDDIAHHLTMSKRTLYQLFADKEDLLLACCQHHDLTMHDSIDELYKNSTNVLEFVLNLFRLKLKEFDETNPRFFVDLHKYPKVINYINNQQRSQEAEAERFLSLGIEQGVFRADVNFRIVIRQMMSGMDTIVRNGLADEYSQTDLMLNTIVPYLRGCCTLIGIQMFDKFLDQLKK